MIFMVFVIVMMIFMIIVVAMMIFIIIIIITIMRKPGDQTEESVHPHSSLVQANQPKALGSDQELCQYEMKIIMVIIKEQFSKGKPTNP